jgi:hypothetical protein
LHGSEIRNKDEGTYDTAAMAPRSNSSTESTSEISYLANTVQNSSSVQIKMMAILKRESLSLRSNIYVPGTIKMDLPELDL